ncbi:iron-sulfur cluster repair protein YtfE [Achromobacter anxifer]|jgi:regulator of cell morphogenesis and NO signaling|uniref:iron-sulfur cluster repair protein YtfE n=1 Tax=Achromobacter anxifer TaxID=1287737 RepID=UPI00155B76C8|nr:iron-sulfur cluster repair protein YtfE [Achromobacter anxifer]MDF8364036.1 iron-sulfur cluster repair protein YtfE [Achromobacter anxifer]CAB5512915.1 Iron-sulfur cluster repair protein YtfE [Achromobacter anxifer]
MNLAEQSLGQLARSIPGATQVFHEYQLDFCCGGKKSLAEAAAQRSLDAAQIEARLAELARNPSQETDWGQASTAELVDHILARYHEVHRQQLPELIRLALKVEQVHADSPDCPTGLAEHLRGMQQELESHMQKEEQVLFPMLARGHGAMAGMPIMVMRAEHDDHGVALERLLALTNGITLPRAACNTWRALYLGLRAFKEDLMAHIHLENNILFENAAGMATRGHG